MLGLKPIKLLPARERVASALRKAIIAQQIKEGETNTNIAEIRELVMATNPSADGKELTDAIRAMTLCGIVVSDKGGGKSAALHRNPCRRYAGCRCRPRTLDQPV